MPRRKKPLDALLPATVTEQGKVFATCKPVEFRYVRNTESSPNFGPRFQQHIEPAGRYVIHNEDPRSGLVPGYEVGHAALQCPLVIEFNPNVPVEDGYGPSSWKARLHTTFKAAGTTLTRKLRSLGYDGVVTAHTKDNETGEIVLLPPSQLSRRRKR